MNINWDDADYYFNEAMINQAAIDAENAAAPAAPDDEI